MIADAGNQADPRNCANCCNFNSTCSFDTGLPNGGYTCCECFAESWLARPSQDLANPIHVQRASPRPKQRLGSGSVMSRAAIHGAQWVECSGQKPSKRAHARCS